MNGNKYFNLTNTLIGNQYPFFLGNARLSDAYYLYQVTSPGMDEDFIPYISMVKISEKTKTEPYGRGSDVISMCVGSKKNIQETGVDYLYGILKKDDTYIKQNGKEFPWILMTPGNGMQKVIITSLRDTIRWKTYKFIPGNYIDMLWTSRDFLVFKICGEKDTIWLEPHSAYRCTDVEMENPLDVDWNRVAYPREKFTGYTRASDLNRTLKRVEWSSFDRKPFSFSRR